MFRKLKTHLPILLLCLTTGLGVWWLTGRVDNRDVLEVAFSIERGGYAKLNESGVPVRIAHRGVEILPASKCGGSYCCGYTFWVAIQAAERRDLLEQLEPYQVKRMQREWYGTTKATAEHQIIPALENAGIGYRVSPAGVQQGDFAVFHRTIGSGHSVIFLRWIYHDDVVIGLEYRSSQPASGGVGNAVEYFTSSGRRDATINPGRIHFARLR